jgi:hypothetical protein
MAILVPRGILISLKATIGTEKHLNHGTLHAQKTLTTIQNISRNNTAFYLEYYLHVI